MEKRKINLARSHLKEIRQEFGVTRQTVDASLSYYNNSNKAKAIRARAKELLRQELEKVESYED